MRKFIDLTGQRFGKLTVLKRVENDKHHRVRWLCQCECGKETIAVAEHLKNGDKKSCGCLTGEYSLVGKKFGELTVINYAGHGKWNVICSCGTQKQVGTHPLKSGQTISCGCVQRKHLLESNITHGKSNTRLFRVWCGMKRRCYDKNNPEYKRYGKRGIIVCEEWQGFEPFYEWAMANGYNPNAKRGECTIDRIDFNGNYEPSNCRWVNNTTQQNNKRNNHCLEFNGKTQTLAQWSREIGISIYTLSKRINEHGWTIERALTTPAKRTQKSN